MVEKERIRHRPDNEGDNGPVDDDNQGGNGGGKGVADLKGKLDKLKKELEKTRKRAEEAAASDEKDDSEVKEQEQDAGQ